MRLTSWRLAWQACSDLFFKPEEVLSRLAGSRDWRPAVVSLAVTSVLFAISTVAAQLLGVPLADAPPVPLPAYRWWQAACMPVLVAAGCGLCAGTGTVLFRVFRRPGDFRRLFTLLTPALLAPLWPMLWPTDLAVSLGLLDANLPGFPGLWVRELAPALTVIYMVMLLWQAYSQADRVPLHEAFALAVLSLLPALGWWAAVLR
jgi:hypothetical protein